jgi:hypothetical protein
MQNENCKMQNAKCEMFSRRVHAARKCCSAKIGKATSHFVYEGGVNMIHIVWTGYGFLVAVFVFGFSLIANLITNSVTGGPAYWDAHKWPVAVSLFISAITCWLMGCFFRNRNARSLIDPKNGKEVVLRESHTLFFIPMIWWGPILIVCGLIALVAEFVK